LILPGHGSLSECLLHYNSTMSTTRTTFDSGGKWLVFQTEGIVGNFIYLCTHSGVWVMLITEDPTAVSVL
jgi:hypothetical protein